MPNVQPFILSCEHLSDLGNDAFVLSGNTVLNLCPDCLAHLDLIVYRDIVHSAMKSVLSEQMEVITKDVLSGNG